MLVLEGEGIKIDGLVLSGALVVRAKNGASVTIKGAKVENRGWEWKALDAAAAEGASEEERMRGFTVIKHETRVIEFDSPGEYTVGE